MLACSRQALLCSQQSCDMLLHAVVWQPGTFNKCLCWLAPGKPSNVHSIAVACSFCAHVGLLSASPAIFTAKLWHAGACGCVATRHMGGHFLGACAGLLSASPAIFTAWLWHALACGCMATRHISQVPLLACSRQAQLYSQHSCGILLHVVALQIGAFHKCLC